MPNTNIPATAYRKLLHPISWLVKLFVVIDDSLVAQLLSELHLRVAPQIVALAEGLTDVGSAISNESAKHILG